MIIFLFQRETFKTKNLTLWLTRSLRKQRVLRLAEHGACNVAGQKNPLFGWSIGEIMAFRVC